MSTIDYFVTAGAPLQEFGVESVRCRPRAFLLRDTLHKLHVGYLTD